jgi:hypothetical protein
MAVGAGGAFTVGVNRLPPVGLMDFSVGATVGADVAGALVVVVVVEGVVFSGAFSPWPQAVSKPMEMIAAPPAVAATRRANRPDIMRFPIVCRKLNYIVQKSAASTQANRSKMADPRGVD